MQAWQSSGESSNSGYVQLAHSRSFPTWQELFVGKFRLAEISDLSDKSDMPTADQVRKTVVRALEKAGEGPVGLASAMGIERNYIRDFLQGKKGSLGTEVMLDLSERLGIPFKDLVVTRKK
jgi:hypothetical protein